MKFNEADARKFYGVLGHHQLEYTELRAYNPKTKEMEKVEFVQGAENFIKICREWSGQYHVYAGLNPRKQRGGKNEDVARRTALLIDIDRHHGDEGATEEELKDAENDTVKVVEYLKQNGHPEPYIDMSGNGFHIIPIVDLPVDATTTDRIKEFYKSLPAETDPKNADLARLCKVTGTMSLRGTQRLSYLVSPGEWERDVVLEAYLKSEATTPPTSLDENIPESSGIDNKKIKTYINTMRPCLRLMLNNTNIGAQSESGHLDHEAHLCLVKDAQYHGLGLPEVEAIFAQQPDYKKEVTRRLVKAAMLDNVQKGVTPWYCDNLIKRGWCISEDPALCLMLVNDPLKAPQKKPKKEATDKATELINLAHENAIEFFRDQYQTGYATLTNSDTTDAKDGNFEKYAKPIFKNSGNSFQNSVNSVGSVTKTISLNSKQFKWWLARLYHEKTKGAVSRDYINSAIMVLEAETQTKPARMLYNRVAPDGSGGVWWDMGDDSGRAIYIDKNGWEIKSSPQIFRRYPHTQPILKPVKDGTLEPILSYLNVESPGDKLLAIVAAITYLIPEVPHVGTTITGRQGSGKSTFHLLLQNLIDPSGVDLLNLPTKDDDLVQILEHHYLAIFDNVNKLSRTQSDILCRAITGAGNEKRELYTTDDSFIRKFMRCVGLNGITIPIEKSDLFSRNLLLPWEPIGDDARRTDAEMKAQMQKDAPILIGAILDVLVKAMSLYSDTKTRINVRMADYAKWGCAITEALGLKKSDFEKAYIENIKNQDEEAVRASMVAEEIIRYMRITQRTQISGSATDLKKEIEEFENPLDDRGRPTGDLLSKREGWPKNSTHFGRELTEVAPSLEAIGYKITTPKKKGARSSGSRNYTIEKLVSADEPKTEKGQRTFNSVDPDELTDERLKTALKFKKYKEPERVEVEVEQPKPIERPRDSLSELLKKTLDLFPLDRDQSIGEDELFDLMAKDMFLNRTDSVKIIAVLMRDGSIFSPRPGFYKRV